MDYSMLIAAKGTPGSIATWLNNSTIQADAPEIVLESESWIYRRLRHFKMMSAPLTGTMTIGNDYITSPSDLLEPFLLWTCGEFKQIITMKTPQEVIANWAYTTSGGAYVRVQQLPLMFYQDATSLRFESVADQAYDYAMLYFQQPAALSITNTNFLTATYPRLLRCACMAAATEWTKESGAGSFDRTYWDQLCLDEIEKAQAESDRAKRATEAGAILIGGGISSNFPFYVSGF